MSSSSASGASRRWTVATLVVAAFVLAGAEAAARLLAPELPAPQLWSHAEAQEKMAQMEVLTEEGSGATVVFAGSSTMWYGLDPQVFSRADAEQRSAYNAGIVAGIPQIQRHWLLEEVVPRLKPRLVVLGLSSFDLNKEISGRPIKQYFESPAIKSGFWGRLNRKAGRASYLVRYRIQLRDFTAVAGAIRSLFANTPTPGTGRSEAGPLGVYSGRRPVRYSFKGEARYRREVLPDFSLGGAPDRALIQIGERLKKAGIRLCLVEMPVTDDYKAVHPRGAEDYEAFRRHLRALARRLKVPLIDLSHLGNDVSLFVDPVHLDKSGSRRFTSDLTDALNPDSSSCGGS